MIKKYVGLNANIFLVFTMWMKKCEIFSAGIGKSSRVPDARELYNAGSGD